MYVYSQLLMLTFRAMYQNLDFYVTTVDDSGVG